MEAIARPAARARWSRSANRNKASHRRSHIQSHMRGDDADSSKRPRRASVRKHAADMKIPDVPLQEPILITDTGARPAMLIAVA